MADQDYSGYSAWHYAADALPRVLPRADGRFDLHIPVGTWAREPAAAAVTVRWKPPNGAFTAVPAEDMVALDDGFAERLRIADAEPVTGPRPLAVAPYRLALARRGKNRYVDAVVRDLDALTEVEYEIEVAFPGGPVLRRGPYSVLVCAPSFTADHMIGGRPAGVLDTEPAWIGHVRRDGDHTHVRIDLDDVPADGPVPVRVRIGGRWIDADPGVVAQTPGARVPLVDWPADTVTFSAADPHREPVVVQVGSRQVGEGAAGGPGRSRLLIAQFCIQGINDLLGEPVAAYSPPRTYMQVTMSDEDGVYSSRPGVERAQPGGYRDGLALHRRHDVPYLLAVNGGVLVLTAHDCPEDLAQMRADTAAGLLHPAVAGYGSHRIPYFTAETNRRDVTACLDAIRTHLEPAREPDVFYPDQRLYKKGANTAAALEKPVRYVVLDSATGYLDNAESIRGAGTQGGDDVDSAMLWTDRRTGAHVLFIDTTLKDQALGANLDPGRPGLWKPPLSVRRRFMQLALDPGTRHRNLLTYGDDFEKACNNGWFEPSTGMRERWSALLGWVAAHRSWLHVVTTADLDPALDSAGTIDVVTSIDPSLDPGGIRSVDQYDKLFHYDTWQQVWAQTRARWIGGTLGEVTAAVEKTLVNWPADARDQLYETGWLAFLMAQHENSWNMQALEGDDPNRKPVGDPEEFTIVEGLQVRNALVWLKASLWARWAAGRGQDPQAAIADLPAGVPGPGRDARSWDADPNPTEVLYNEQALVVVDRNGGRVTHAFVLGRDGLPRTVSGTFKSYQYRDRNGGTECDGHVVQNTVWTPNHRYLGTDLDHLGLRTVDWTYTRPVTATDLGRRPVTRIVPDNFNAYAVHDRTAESVRLDHEPGSTPDRVTQDELIGLLERDGAAKRNGEPGVVWHDGAAFGKTFRLVGTTLEVSYSGVAPEHLVDNELCVDLWAGAQGGHQLRRRFDPATGGLTVAMSNGAAAAVRPGTGCELTADSRIETVADAAARGRTAEFLGLHRVLTEAVQLRATAPDFDYAIDLRA